eukprot:gb/GEZN01017230.1/.p1 GENE.gb/GEZN01017230.1/~~gb/GEZN01017230.1/.p1  ORF type:complete len:266 (-),score=16.42 gb/GEZN01017230.1/:9-713(-)
MRHPCMVKLAAALTSSSSEYCGLVFPRASGDIGQLLRIKPNKPDTKCSLDDRLWIAIQVAEALVFMHSHGHVHRDLKPDNILVSGQPIFHDQLIDFGLTRKTIGSAGIETSHPGTRTLAYAAPEQSRQGVKITSAAHVFAFGLLLLFLISGLEFPSNYTRRVSAFNGHVSDSRSASKGWWSSESDRKGKLLLLSFLCVGGSEVASQSDAAARDEPEHRPSMQQVLKELYLLCNH